MGDVASLIRDSLQGKVYMVAFDEYTKFMWIHNRFLAPPLKDFYLAVSPTSYEFVVHRDSIDDSHLDLYASITQYSTIGEAILLGDFNDLVIALHNHSKDVFCTWEIDPKFVELHRLSKDALEPITSYGKHPLQLGESHKLLILNHLTYFLDSHYSCFTNGGGASIVDCHN
jgi:hypothetical protein